ncbi:endonuclease V [Paractinoplanes rishiriensis]|uniref:Endonuclease V n=2 Tax=Paractinoplanes rishiriensis TaxID=1050105 RepID=A0A919MZP5_9ACTN|nr:endonuclease V [Actinoplanes rishiriensis]
MATLSAMRPDEAERVQDELRTRLVLPAGRGPLPGTVVGLDVTYDTGSDRAVAAAVLVEVSSRAVLEVATAAGEVTFPYVPGLLAFREVPLLLAAIDRLSQPPPLLICDGYGVAHPRRFGLACHLGVLLDVPAFGVAKTAFVGTGPEPAAHRGAWSDLTDRGEVVGRRVRTRDHTKPVFVSAGHRIALADCTDLAVRLSAGFRIPEPTRQADISSRAALRASQNG